MFSYDAWRVWRTPDKRQEIRDQSFIQNLSRSFRFTAPWWCFSSSVHPTHFLQGSVLRTGMAIAEAWFCDQWSIFHLECLLFLVSSDHRSQCHFKFQSCLIIGYVGWARIIFLETLPNPPYMWWCRLIFFFKGFLTPRVNHFLQFSSCGPWSVFSHPNYPSHHALGRYRHTSSTRQFCIILCWSEILKYCPDGGNGNFHCSSSFIKATSLISEAQLSFAAHQKYIHWNLGFVCPLFIFLWNRKPWLDNFIFIITLEFSK